MGAPDQPTTLASDEPSGSPHEKGSIWPCYDEWSVEQWYASQGA